MKKLQIAVVFAALLGATLLPASAYAARRNEPSHQHSQSYHDHTPHPRSHGSHTAHN